ncbi:hypothetical protein P167DRAFT_537998, partial [Morchella conica CCBAS932]
MFKLTTAHSFRTLGAITVTQYMHTPQPHDMLCKERYTHSRGEGGSCLTAVRDLRPITELGYGCQGQ